MSLRHTFTWKQSADLLAAASRRQAEQAASEAIAAEYRNWEGLFRGCAGAEYKLDAEDMNYFGLVGLTAAQKTALFTS